MDVSGGDRTGVWGHGFLTRLHPSPITNGPQNKKTTGFSSLEELTDAALPKHIRLTETVELEPAKSES